MPVRMEVGFATLAARMDQLTERVDWLAQRLDQPTERKDQLATGQTATAVQLGHLAERLDARLDRLPGFAGSLRAAVYEGAACGPGWWPGP